MKDEIIIPKYVVSLYVRGEFIGKVTEDSQIKLRHKARAHAKMYGYTRCTIHAKCERTGMEWNFNSVSRK